MALACSVAMTAPDDDGDLADWDLADWDLARLLADSPALAPVVSNADEHRLQIIVGRIQPGENGRPSLHQQSFRAGAEYFYPASSIKMFAAIAALEYLEELRRETGLTIDVDTPLVIHPLRDGEAIDKTDPDNLDGGAITVRQQIRKLFLVSDNTAFNRLYDLVGQERLNASIRRAGIDSARIVHRLSLARTAEENRTAPRVDFLGEDFRYSLPRRRSAPQPEGDLPAGLRVGEAHVTSSGLVEGPMDFTPKNRIALTDLQRGLCMIALSDVDCGGFESRGGGSGGGGFTLRQEDRELLLDAMSRLPRRSTNPVYDSEEYPDHYVKFVLPGVRRVVPDDGVVVYDKSGQAYGFTTENAWIVNRSTGQGFFLAATLYTNANATLNDDEYEYGDVAEPFLADLAEMVARQIWDR